MSSIPDQGNVEQSTDCDDPPQDRRNACRHIGQPFTATLNKIVELSQGLGVDALLALGRRLEGGEMFEYRVDALGSAHRYEALALIRPTGVNDEPSIVAELGLKDEADRRRVALGVAVECGEARCLLCYYVGDGGVVLIGGDSQEAEEQAIKDGEGGESEADHVIGASLAMDPATNQGPEGKYPEPCHCDEDGREQRSNHPGRVVVDPIKH
jgi:hypothetical protein